MADKPTDKSKNLADAFLENVWGKRSYGIDLPEVKWSNAIRHADVEFLLNRYPFLQIINTEPGFSEEIFVKLIPAQSGWIIHDYGDAMSSSPGENIYGNYGASGAKQTDEEGGTGSADLGVGKGTVTNLAVLTAQEMIQLAIEKGWPGVEIIGGTPIMKWAAWMQAEDQQHKLEGFSPSKEDQAKRRRILATRHEEVEPTPTERMRRRR